ncbi:MULTISPECIES: LysR family transcriptional regulator [Pseudomonadaceae]|jgi:LysR family nitrogen assimilation transcriptional regulator|uniref:LysR family transcriptional regulator n=1 Tax=Ectopseudomonas hydrolytica TaxID=2493633 RepID=A0ABY5A4G3_9GAMM|nr:MULTISPECIES: LysR family transcriptional regulator [Pseudomonas]ATH81660.1 LysR family transcriptional regulator [Pseudomonas mendocina]EJO91359.1 LysR family transcriptional regulator [Pseudomonas mendocina DLHK]MBA4242284.1 transcriptional regulator CynR [Pseudomonas sp.]MBF8161252.1 LysR family transcriptional regulator [Pseudomonas mendocina]MDH0095451.1 LysR family transcriptional regulator [Pseudomonas sp. GD04158]
MTLKQLRYLIAIAEAGSFSAAARRAYVAQPALSRQISLLESELEMQLLERQHDGVALTDAGRRLYEVSRSVVQKLDSVKDELASTRGNPIGHVSISIPATVSALLLPEIIRRAEDKFPSINLTICDGLTREGGQSIELGKVDFGVLPNAEELEHVIAEPIFTEDLYWVGPGSSAESGTPISLAQAASTRLVMAPKALHLRRRIEQAAMEAGVTLNVVFEQQSAPGIASLVRHGLAATICNWPPLAELFESTAARLIVEPRITRTVSIAHSAHRPLSFAASCMRDLVRGLLLEMVSDGRWRGSLIERSAEADQAREQAADATS